MKTLRKRVTAIIMKGNKVSLIKRVKPGSEYYIFPGGGVEEGESVEDAMIREVKEELDLDVKKYKFLFSFENVSVPQVATIHKGNRDEYVYHVVEYIGNPEIGGPEKERMGPENQYHIEWIDMPKLLNMKNIYPEIIASNLVKLYKL